MCAQQPLVLHIAMWPHLEPIQSKLKIMEPQKDNQKPLKTKSKRQCVQRLPCFGEELFKQKGPTFCLFFLQNGLFISSKRSFRMFNIPLFIYNHT